MPTRVQSSFFYISVFKAHHLGSPGTTRTSVLELSLGHHSTWLPGCFHRTSCPSSRSQSIDFSRKRAGSLAPLPSELICPNTDSSKDKIGLLRTRTTDSVGIPASPSLSRLLSAHRLSLRHFVRLKMVLRCGSNSPLYEHLCVPAPHMQVQPLVALTLPRTHTKGAQRQQS